MIVRILHGGSVWTGIDSKEMKPLKGCHLFQLVPPSFLPFSKNGPSFATPQILAGRPATGAVDSF